MTDDATAWGSIDPGALSFIRLYCQWHIAPVRTEEVRPRSVAGHSLILPSMKITALTSLTVDGEEVVIPEFDWSEDGRVRLPGCEYLPLHRRRLDGVRATITHGFAAAPPELIALGKRLKYLFETGPASIRVGNISITPAAVSQASQGLEPYMIGILDSYRLAPLS